MQLDRFFIFLSLSFLPILWLPKQWLLQAVIFCLIFTILGILKRNLWLLVFGLLLSVNYLQILSIAKNAENQTAYKSRQQIEIIKILKQQEYQAAIAKLGNNKAIYLTWQTATPLLLNQRYQAELNFRSISGRSNIGNFDRQRWYFANHIEAIATVRKAELLAQEDFPIRSQWLNRVFEQTVELPTQGLLLALAFGERAWLKAEQWQIFQQTATAHLIAISGLHIALAMWFGFWFAKVGQWLLLKIGKLQAVGFCYIFPRIIGFAVAFAYSYLAGFALPTLRALLAISVLLACQLARRHYTASQLWWRIVTILLVLDPVAVLSDSFWLSILAVASLILWYHYFPLAKFHWLGRTEKFKPLWSLLHLQLGILLVFAPVQFFFFEGSSPFSFIANLLIVPLYSFLLVPLILFSLLTDNLLQTWLLADWLAQLSLWLIEPMSHYWWQLNQWQQWQILTANLLILLLIYWRNERKAPSFLWKGLGLIMLFNISFHLPKLGEAKAEWVTFDVGQGLAQALVYRDTSGQKRAIFYDTGVGWGEGNNKSSMAELEILPYLIRNGIELEAIFLSHDDNDHSGGVTSLLQKFPRARLLSSSHKMYLDKTPEACIKGKVWQFGDFHLKAIYPEHRVERAENRDSCIILVKFDRLQWILTGDTGVEQERIWANEAGPVDFLQIAHHGSQTSTSETLLAQTQPYLAIVSVGRWNPWKMPTKSVIERLERHQIPLLNTAKEGMIRVKFYAGNYHIEVARSKFISWYKGYF